jgi:RNase P/RNase MRP subunit POP5
MASRYLNQFLLSMRKGHVTECGTISLSAAAAVTSSDFSSLVSSVTKSATGTYTIALADKWVGLLNVMVSTEGGQAGIRTAIVSADPVTAKTVVVKTVDAAGATTDVSATAKLHVTISLKNSTAR